MPLSSSNAYFLKVSTTADFGPSDSASPSLNRILTLPVLPKLPEISPSAPPADVTRMPVKSERSVSFLKSPVHTAVMPSFSMRSMRPSRPFSLYTRRRASSALFLASNAHERRPWNMSLHVGVCASVSSFAAIMSAPSGHVTAVSKSKSAHCSRGQPTPERARSSSLGSKVPGPKSSSWWQYSPPKSKAGSAPSPPPPPLAASGASLPKNLTVAITVACPTVTCTFCLDAIALL
mmetsp:Transcript_6775/g.27682  ORF Transcript_6775/g.27682 Transcript_6775/m.27682 type:complete len:234 (+) Transcript_6775:607-1308(+)